MFFKVENILQLFELIYYVSFIILTVLLVIYAIKTYIFQSSKHSELTCKITVDGNNYEDKNFKCRKASVVLEIYNYGNMMSKSISIFLNDSKDVFTTIDFIKPEESIYIPIGTITVYGEGDIRQIELNDDTQIEQGDTVSVVLQNDKSVEYQLSTDYLFAYSQLINGSLHELAKDINFIGQQVHGLSNSTSSISEAIYRMFAGTRKD